MYELSLKLQCHYNDGQNTTVFVRVREAHAGMFMIFPFFQQTSLLGFEVNKTQIGFENKFFLLFVRSFSQLIEEANC